MALCKWTFVLIALLISRSIGYAGESSLIGHWRFEGKAQTSATNQMIFPREKGEGSGKGHTEGQAKLTFADEVSGPYIYDPLTGKSYENKTSLHFKPGNERAYVQVPVDPKQLENGFTLELLVRPAAGFNKEVPLGVLADTQEKSRAGLVTDRSSNYTWLAAIFRTPDGKGYRWNVGYYLGSGRVTNEETWRHMAIVYDAQEKKITYWLDHFQTQTRDLPVSLKWSDSALYIGGQPKGGAFAGHIDEVRLTKGALPRTKFLRARDTPAENVQFETEYVVMPRDSGYIDLKEAFGAAGDGKTDDTRAFREAFKHLANKQPLRNYILYIPPGEYLISDEIRWTRFLFVQGAGRDKSIIRLKDQCPRYGDSQNPKGVLTVAWRDFTPKATGNAGNNIGSYLHDVTINTGKDNPGAVGLAYHSNNHGSVTNVTIRSEDGQGWAGLALADNWPGPCLIKDVTIQGFDKGIYSIVSQYSITFKDLQLENQNEVGIYNRNQMLWIDGLSSKNRVPVMDSRGLIVLVNGRFTGGNKDETAIQLEGGYGLYRNIHLDGYKYAIKQKLKKETKERIEITKSDGYSKGYLDGKTLFVKTSYIQEQVFGNISHLFPSPKRSLSLPIKSQPSLRFARKHPDLWTNLMDFEDKVKNDDWAPAIQAAIDSGASILYVPNRVVLKVKSPVHIRGNVRHMFGFYSGVHPHKGYEGPIFIYDNPDPNHVLLVDRFVTSRLHHASPGTLIIRDTSTVYTNKPEAGDLFAENTQGRYKITKQNAWFWQLNVEYDAPAGTARFENHGGRVVIVGMKTEKKGTNILTTDGGLTELLGGYFYPNRGTGGQSSIIIDNAGFSGTWRNYWSRYDPVVRETRNGVTKGGGERYQGLYVGYDAQMAPQSKLQPYQGR